MMVNLKRRWLFLLLLRLRHRIRLDSKDIWAVLVDSYIYVEILFLLSVLIVISPPFYQLLIARCLRNTKFNLIKSQFIFDNMDLYDGVQLLFNDENRITQRRCVVLSNLSYWITLINQLFSMCVEKSRYLFSERRRS